MQEHQMIEQAHQYMQVWNVQGDYLLDTVADKNITVNYTHFEKPYQGIESYRQMLKMTYHFFPDLKIEVLEIIPNANKATVRWQYVGTHSNGKLFGHEATGKRIRVQGLTILEFANERVLKEYGIVDNLSLLMQLETLK